MKSLEEYVEAKLNFESAEVEFISELCDILKINPTHIKKIWMSHQQSEGWKVVQMIRIELIGTNTIRSEDLSKIEGLSITTPNLLEIEVGEIHL